MHGSNEHSLITISEKTFLYGTLIWLWVEAGLPGLLATISVGLSLLLCSFAEMYIPTRVAETTDAVLALLVGGFMLFLAKRHPRSQEITELTTPGARGTTPWGLHYINKLSGPPTFYQ